MSRTRVLIADDHPSVLKRVVALLSDRFEIVATVSDGGLLVETATRLRPDVIVTDIWMPGGSGVSALAQLKAAGSEAKVVVLTMEADADLAAELIRAGASGFVLKMQAAAELPSAIEQVMLGRVYVTVGLRVDRLKFT